MALELWEIIIIAVVLVLFLRPRTVTDAARSTGRAVAEFRRAFTSGSEEPSEDMKQLARTLGIVSAGKSAQQLSDEIVARKQTVGR